MWASGNTNSRQQVGYGKREGRGFLVDGYG